MRRAVFLDRDGTIIVDRGYLADPDGVELLPDALRALRAFRAEDRLLVLVSNQSGIARGLIRWEAHERVHARVQELLSAQGVPLDAAYYCPHGPDEGCACRKPLPGMLRAASEEHAIDLTASWMVGDKTSDIEAGRAAGCKTALLGGIEANADLRGANWSELMRALGC